MSEVDIPVGKILSLLGKTIRFSTGGFTVAERRDLGHDLLLLASHVLQGIADEDGKQLEMFNRAIDSDGLGPDRLT